jgi:hypothetical protein
MASVTPNTFGSVIFLRSLGQIARQSDRRAAFSWLFEVCVLNPRPFFELGYGFQLEATYKVTKSLVGIERTQHSNRKKFSNLPTTRHQPMCKSVIGRNTRQEH